MDSDVASEDGSTLFGLDVESGALGAARGVGVKGSFAMLGKLDGSRFVSAVRNSIDLTKTTWQFSGCVLD